MAISFLELYKEEDKALLTEDIHSNLSRLHYALNFIRLLYNEPMIIDRGFSTPEEQKALYEKKGLPPRMGSQHLQGGAADIFDPEQKLQRWILDHLHVSEALNVYYEVFTATPRWVHLQIYPPLSENRFFFP